MIFQVLLSMATWLVGCILCIYKHEWLSQRGECREPVEHENLEGKLYKSWSQTLHLRSLFLHFVVDVGIFAYFYKNNFSQQNGKFNLDIFRKHD